MEYICFMLWLKINIVRYVFVFYLGIDCLILDVDDFVIY